MDIEAFRRLYPDTPNEELAGLFGMTEVAVRLFASRHGIHKSQEYRSRIQAERMLGRERSEETRARLRAKVPNRVASGKWRASLKGRRVLRGEEHPNWKGGRPWERFKDPRYIAWRNAVLERDGYICQECGRQCKCRERGLAAHHIKPYAEHPDLRYEVSNGKTLCRSCHMALHNRPIPPKPPIPCGCGCGILIAPFDRYGRPRKFALYHGPNKGKTMSESTKAILREQRQGKPHTAEHRQKIAEGLRNSSKRIGRPPKMTQPH